MAVNLTDVFTYIAIFGFFFLFLKYLLTVAKKTITAQHPIQKEDDFMKANDYSFDFVLVFGVVDEGEDDFTLDQIKHSFRVCVSRLAAANLETQYFYSCQRDELYVKIRASPLRLKEEADRINYKLLLDSERLRTRAQAGKKDSESGKWLWKPIIIFDECNQSPYSPFDFIYGGYSMNPEVQTLYKTYSGGDTKSFFKGVDRIKLIISIIEANVNEHGACLDIGALIANKSLITAMPIHDYDELKKLQKKWLKLWSWPWNQPIDEVRDYFGEKIALYFLYLQHYVTMLIPMALGGAITYIVRVIYKTPENFLMPYFTAIMVIWSTFFIEFWKKLQARKAMEWGVVGFESEEQDRPEFMGVPSTSPVDGKPQKYFSSAEKSRIANIVLVTITLMIMGVICIVASIFTFQWYVSDPLIAQQMTIMGFNPASIIVSLANAVVIGVLNSAYIGTATRLNYWENHRTDTEFEDALIAKIFVFQLVNTFAALTYVSFIKFSFLGIFCNKNNCTADVASTLSTVFLSNLISRAIVQVVVRKYAQDQKTAHETSGLEPGVTASPIEDQYVLAEYHSMQGTLQDFAGLVMQYGFTVLFVAAFPLAPTMALVSSYIQIRIDGWKLCQVHRRPVPCTAEDIGQWQTMIEILSVVGVLYNFGLIFLTGHYLVDMPWEHRWVLFMIIENCVLILKYFLAEVIDDIPAEVQMQMDRNEFLVGKVLLNGCDDSDDSDDEGLERLPTNIIINTTDFDWDDPEEDDEGNDDDEEEGEEEEEGAGDEDDDQQPEDNIDDDVEIEDEKIDDDYSRHASVN